MLDWRILDVIASPGLNIKAGAWLKAEAISWWRTDIASAFRISKPMALDPGLSMTSHVIPDIRQPSAAY